MIVAKFGGSSVKDAASMIRCCEIISKQESTALVVISATKNTTNELELIANSAFQNDLEHTFELIESLIKRHILIRCELKLFSDLDETLISLKLECHNIVKSIYKAKSLSSQNMDALYSVGERLSSFLFSEYLKKNINRDVVLKDARKLIKTDSTFCEATPDLVEVNKAVNNHLKDEIEKGSLVITQGFIGSDSKGRTTTLGREGSDYSATLLGEAIKASEIQIWTDVEGVATFDPRLLNEVKFISELSYEEASTMALLGAKVLFPKTLFPAQRENIPVIVKSSLKPKLMGTIIHKKPAKENKVRGLSLIEGENNSTLSLIGYDLSVVKLPYSILEKSTLSITYSITNKELKKAIKQLHDIVLTHF